MSQQDANAYQVCLRFVNDVRRSNLATWTLFR
jgi:hypothetical protein